MKLLKKLTSILLVIAMIGGIAACSKTSEKDSDSGKKKTKKTEKVSVSGDDDDDGDEDETEATLDPSVESSIDEVVAQPALEPAEPIEVTTDMGVKVKIEDDIDIPKDTEMEVTQMEEVTDDAIGATYTEYEITLGDIHELGGYVELRLPYNEANIPAGEDPAQCVGAMYFDETEGEWVPVDYEVDTASKEVVIYTDHFSKYRCYEFKDEGKRLAQIIKVSDVLDKVDFEDAKKAMEEFVYYEFPDEDCRAVVAPYVEEAFKDFVSKTGDSSTYVGNIVTNLVTLAGGDQAFEHMPKSSKIIECMGKAGLYISVVTFMMSVTKDDKTSDDILQIYKDAAYLLVAASGSSWLGGIAAAAWLVDLTVSEVASFVRGSVKEDEMKAYRYYMNSNDTYNDHRHLSRAEWRKIIYDIATQPPTSKDFDANNEIMKKIDDYCNEFWTMNSSIRYEVYDDVGLMGSLQADKKMQEEISAEYKGELLDELQGVFAAVQLQLQREARQAAMKELNKLIKYFNETYTVNIKEVVDKDKKPRFGGCQAVFSPLYSEENKEEWTVILDDKGCAKVDMTWIGYILAGEPNEVQIYAPNADLTKPETKPLLKVPFSMLNLNVELKYEGIPLEDLIGIYNGTVNILSIEATDEGFEAMKASMTEQFGDDEGSMKVDGTAINELTKPECDAILNENIKQGDNSADLSDVEITSDDPSSGKCVITMRFNNDDGPQTVIPMDCEYSDGVFTINGPVGGYALLSSGEGEEGGVTVVTGTITVSETDDLYILQSPSIKMNAVMGDGNVQVEMAYMTYELEVSKDKEG